MTARSDVGAKSDRDGVPLVILVAWSEVRRALLSY